MNCTDLCTRPTPAQAHCGACHRTFGGVRAFDLHRSNHNSFIQTRNRCADPATLGMTEIAGVWRRDVGQRREYPRR